MMRQLSNSQESAGRELRLGSINSVNDHSVTTVMSLTYLEDQEAVPPLFSLDRGAK